ncbi:ABC transporter substrate-binding protein [Faecalicatena contorta]|uniref:ABC transporter substrate-binding protein n=1 Tax=Faecalicatena contorta TaxID=39482 RepID=UPI002ED61BB1
MKKRMKKISAILLAFAMTASMLAGCGSSAADSSSEEQTQSESQSGAQETESEPVDVNVTALKGPTAMGMVQMMDDADNGKIDSENYQFTIAASIDEVTPSISQGETDIAAVPANVSSVLYNKLEGGVQVLAINTLGVLYIVENGDTVQSVADLRGKTIYASGKGATPEYALNYILQENGIDPASDVTIEWKSEHSECVAALAQDPSGIAMLPQPFVTTAQAQNPDLRVALDLTEEWDKIQENAENPSALLTGVVIVRTEFAKEHPEAVSDFMERYKSSVEFVNENVDEAAQLVGNYDIVPAEVAKKAIPACNIVCITGDEMQEKLSGYLAVLNEQNPEAVGGQLPDDDFYYTQE